jgi:uncharacterized membrane protein YoaK (UPF0700 family)
MQRYAPRTIPPTLSFLAGYVDSCTFLALFGLFVAQVTGSFVLTGTQFVMQKPGVVIKLAEIFAFFLAGVATTVLVRSAERGGRSPLPLALALEAMLLTGLFVLWAVTSPLPGPDSPTVLFASLAGLSAMGVQSALVRLMWQGSPSTNVMTTNTTQLAIDTTEFVLAWWPHLRAPANVNAAAEYAEIKRRLTKLWPVMLGFFFGTLAGAVGYVWLDLWCVVLPIAIIGAMLVWAAKGQR